MIMFMMVRVMVMIRNRMRKIMVMRKEMMVIISGLSLLLRVAELN